MPQLFHLIQSVKLNAFKACNIPAKEWKDFVKGKIVVCHGPAFHIMEVSIAFHFNGQEDQLENRKFYI